MAPRLRGARAYEAAFAAGDILFADPFLIHSTTKNKPSLRLSIDFRSAARTKLAADALAPGCRDANYLRWPKWRDIGAGLKLESTEKIGEFKGLPGKTKDQYAAGYTISDAAVCRADAA